MRKILHYFSWKDAGIIAGLSIFAVVFGYIGLPYLIPSLGGAGFVHGLLKLPGPGAGVVISSAFVCFWMLLGILLTKKSGSALLTGVLITIIRVVVGATLGIIPTDPHNAVAAVTMNAPVLALLARVDVIPVCALIIEGLYLAPLEKKPWKYIFPTCIVLLSILVIIMILTAQTTIGEGGSKISAEFPLGYAAIAILGLAIAIVCYLHPLKYLVCLGVSNLYYIMHYWLFWGKTGFATRFPALQALPVLVLYALVTGALLGLLIYGVFLLFNTYQGKTERSLLGDQ